MPTKKKMMPKTKSTPATTVTNKKKLVNQSDAAVAGTLHGIEQAVFARGLQGSLIEMGETVRDGVRVQRIDMTLFIKMSERQHVDEEVGVKPG